MLDSKQTKNKNKNAVNWSVRSKRHANTNTQLNNHQPSEWNGSYKESRQKARPTNKISVCCVCVCVKRTRQRKRWTGRRGYSFRFCIHAFLWIVRMCLPLWMTLHFNGFSLFTLCSIHCYTLCVCVCVRARARVWVYAYLLRHMFHQKCVCKHTHTHIMAEVLSVKFYYLPPISMFPIPSNQIPSILYVYIFYTSDCFHSPFLFKSSPSSRCRCFLIFYSTVKMTFKYFLLSALTHHTDVWIHSSALRLNNKLWACGRRWKLYELALFVLDSYVTNYLLFF